MTELLNHAAGHARTAAAQRRRMVGVIVAAGMHHQRTLLDVGQLQARRQHGIGGIARASGISARLAAWLEGTNLPGAELLRTLAERGYIVFTYDVQGQGTSETLPHENDQVNALPRTRSVSRNLQLKLVGAATFVEPDGSGRIGLPASHRNTVGIERKAVLVGMGDKFELWSEQAHLAQIRQTLTDADLGDVPLDLQL